MAEGLNKVMLIGNLGQNPELRFTQSETAVLNFSLATNERWQDKHSGEWQDRTEWHKIIVWGKRAEGLSKFLLKGHTVFVEGKIQNRMWEDKEGNKRYSIEIVASKVVVLKGGEKRPQREPGEDYGGYDDRRGPPPPSDFSDDDIPF